MECLVKEGKIFSPSWVPKKAISKVETRMVHLKTAARHGITVRKRVQFRISLKQRRTVMTVTKNGKDRKYYIDCIIIERYLTV